MSEIKRQPEVVQDAEREIVIFDEGHTLSDFVRYLLTQADREELAYLVANVEAA